MKQKRPSITDISKALNVSITTISFVLNGKGKERKISDEVIKRIQEYADKINYKPNIVAQSLRTGKTKILVFMVEDISNHFFARIARSIEEIAYRKGYKVLFCSTENDDKRSSELISLFYDRQVDGFILVPSTGVRADVEKLIKNDVPVVLCDRYFEDLDTHYVVINNYEASKKATSHLIENGFTKPIFITTDAQQSQMINRKNGYEDAIKDAGLAISVLEIPYAETNSQRSKEYLNTLFSKPNSFDSVFFATNYLALIGLEIIKEKHPELLKTLGIVTFDDYAFFKINTPSISAVVQPLQEIAEELMRIMFTLLKDKDSSRTKIQTVLNTQLIQRDSTLPKKGG